MRQRIQNANCRHKQRQQIQHGRAEFDNRADCSKVMSHHRCIRALNRDRSELRGQQSKAGRSRKCKQGEDVRKPHYFRSATALVNPPTNKSTMLRGHRFDLVLFHLSKPPTVFTILRTSPSSFFCEYYAKISSRVYANIIIV